MKIRDHSTELLIAVAAIVAGFYWYSNRSKKVAGTNVNYVTQTSSAGGVKIYSDGTSIDANGNYYDTNGNLVWTAPQS